MATWSSSTFTGVHIDGGRRPFPSFTVPAYSNFWAKRRIIFLAGAHRVWNSTRNRLCVTVTLFVSANKRTSCALSATVNFQMCQPFMRQLVHTCIWHITDI
jgi:hypothetical protein